MATPPRYLLRQVFPPFTLPRTCNLPNSDLDCTPLPLPLFNIFSGNSGSLCCKLCPCTPSKPACRLQYVTWTWHHDPASPMPQTVNMAKTPNKEKSYKKYLSPNALTSGGSILSLHSVPHPGECEHMYTGISTTHTNAACISPAPYLTHPSCPYQLELFRIRTQHTIYIIPIHLHYAFRAPRADYRDRVCPRCIAKGTTVLGDELHIICQCPATKGVLQQFTAKCQGLTRLLDLPSFASFTSDEMTRIVLGNPPPQVLQKGLKGWIIEATPICSEFAYALRMHIASLHPANVFGLNCFYYWKQ